MSAARTPSPAPNWPEPAAPPDLPAGVVHVWSVCLESPGVAFDELEVLLSADEHERAGRFRLGAHRRNYIVRRGMLRRLLGGYLDIEPARLRFTYSAFGKPALSDGMAGDLGFNLSDTDGLALYAFARGGPLGVDVEVERAIPEAGAISEGYFSPAECAALRALPGGQRAAGFLNCWTRKEAFIKAVGEGLSYPLAEFDVTLSPGEPARLVRVGRDPHAVDGWLLCDLRPAPGYVGALAVPDRDWAVRCWHHGSGVAAVAAGLVPA